MQKYLKAFYAFLQNQKAYRLSFFSTFFSTLIFITFYYFLWKSIYNNQSENFEISGYTFKSLFTYYCVSYCFRFLVSSSKSTTLLAQEIHTGMFSNLMLKPIKYIWYSFTRTISDRILKIILPIIFLISLFVFGNNVIHLPKNLFLFVLSIVFSIIINHFTNIIVGLIAFYVVSINGIYNIYMRVSDVLSGTLFPLNMLPGFLTTTIAVLPFKYTTYNTILIYLGKMNTEEITFHFLMQGFWIVLLYCLFNFMFNKSIKSNESVGI